VEEVERQLATVSGDTPTDTMLDLYNGLLATLNDDRAPLNERLLRLFKEVRIAVHDEAIGVLPLMREDVIELHGSVALKIVGHAAEVELSDMWDKNIGMVSHRSYCSCRPRPPRSCCRIWITPHMSGNAETAMNSATLPFRIGP
jgi:hypothetical protein